MKALLTCTFLLLAIITSINPPEPVAVNGEVISQVASAAP
jgi:hypothetical protein